MAAWEIMWALSDSPNLDSLLAQGWEPFGVTKDSVVTKIWLRRQRRS